MFSLRLVFLAMGISMTLSAAVLGGGSPNDKIDTILSVVYNLSDRMGNIESKVKNIDLMEELTAEKVSKIEDRVQELVHEGMYVCISLFKDGNNKILIKILKKQTSTINLLKSNINE